MSEERQPCPTCGCVLYREQGPCEGTAGLAKLAIAVQALQDIAWSGRYNGETPEAEDAREVLQKIKGEE